MDAPSTFRLSDKARQSTTKHRAFYQSVTWRRLSRLVIRRDPICRICNDRPSRQADHIVALSDGGKPFDMANLQGLCLVCHRIKTTRETQARKQ